MVHFSQTNIILVEPNNFFFSHVVCHPKLRTYATHVMSLCLWQVFLLFKTNNSFLMKKTRTVCIRRLTHTLLHTGISISLWVSTFIASSLLSTVHFYVGPLDTTDGLFITTFFFSRLPQTAQITSKLYHIDLMRTKLVLLLVV